MIKKLMLSSYIMLLYISSVNFAQANLWSDMINYNKNENHYTNKGNYLNEDNSYVSATAYGQSYGYQYAIQKYDQSGKIVSQYLWIYINTTVNGVAEEGKTPRNSNKTFDFDENGRLQAIYNSQNNGGGLIEKFKYAEDGQMLVYNPQGELVGAYNNWFEKKISSLEYAPDPQSLNHLDTQGNYTATDKNGNIATVYKQNGGLISYKYDAAGNLTAIYEDGKQTYARRYYTVDEATAIVSQYNGKNTFKIRYR